MNKLILLDIDGVLTSPAYTLECRRERRRPNAYEMVWFDPACVKALRHIVDTTGAKIVLSSSWRELGDEKLHRLWTENGLPGELAGTTPPWALTKKEAIQAWIADHPDDRYVILDDADLKMDFQVKPNPEVGLTSEDADKAIEFLEKGKRYLSESHLRQCEILRKDVEKMAKHPMTRAEMKAQCDRNRKALQEKLPPSHGKEV